MRYAPRQFTDALIARHRGWGDEWVLHQRLPYGMIVIPAGFETDLMSVPAFARAFISPCGPGVEAAVLHDYLLSRGVKWPVAAAFFREALRHSGIGWSRATIAWAGVRIWGWLKGRR